MAYTPVSGSPIQYSNDSNELASGYYLKFYIANTTTPLSMATDSTGSVPLVKCKLNTDGIPITNPDDNTTTFIPYVDQKFRYVIYKTEADADANTTANAFVNLAEVDTISGSADLGTAAFADLTTGETDTTGALRAEDAYHADSINYHTTNLNQFEFGGENAKFIAGGVARGATEATFFMPSSLFAAATSITVAGTFTARNVLDSVGYGAGLSSITLSNRTSNKLVYLIMTGLSGLTTGQNVYLKTESSASKITVNP